MSDVFSGFTRAERIHLLGRALQGLAPLKITKFPPNRDGDQKSGSPSFCTAVWANRYVNDLEYVLVNEKPREGSEQQPETNGVKADGSPF